MKAGRYRRPRRIQEVLDRQGEYGMSQADLARELGVSRSLVNKTVRGQDNNRNVLKRLLAMGVHPRDLDLPPGLLEKLAGEIAADAADPGREVA